MHTRVKSRAINCKNIYTNNALQESVIFHFTKIEHKPADFIDNEQIDKLIHLSYRIGTISS